MKRSSYKWHVYILKCKDGSLYTGITKDIKNRFAEHKAGKGSKYVRSRVAKKIVYFEIAGSKSKALKREAFIKGLSRVNKLQLIRNSRSVD